MLPCTTLPPETSWRAEFTTGVSFTPTPPALLGSMRPSAPCWGGGGSRRAAFRSLTEGALWGFALWVKPFVVLPALACWLTGSVRLLRAGRGTFWVWDTALLLSGGLLAGGLGILWLGCSGTWP